MSDLSDEAIRAYAANIFDLEDDREQVQTDLKEAWAGIRNAHGKQFADSLKLAVKRARMDQGKRDAADQIDAEADRIFALLSAPSRVARGARTYEAVDHDPITGEIADETPMSHASGQPGGDDPETPDDAASAGETATNTRRMSMTPLEPREAGGLKGFGFTVRFDEPQAAMPAQTGAVETLVANSEAADLATVTVAETDLVPRVAAASEPIADISKPNPICRDPEDCGVYASWHLTCEACKRASAHRVAA